jgi:hypothetical protein
VWPIFSMLLLSAGSALQGLKIIACAMMLAGLRMRTKPRMCQSAIRRSTLLTALRPSKGNPQSAIGLRAKPALCLCGPFSFRRVSRRQVAGQPFG